MANQYINAMTALWNSAGTTYSAIKMNVTNAASAVGSMLFELQVGSVSKFSVDKNGSMIAAGTVTAAGITTSNTLVPSGDDTIALGSPTQGWMDLYLASGAMINWAASDVTITHSANHLAFAGAVNGYTFDSSIRPATSGGAALGTSVLPWNSLSLMSGGQINFGAPDWTAAHAAGVLSVNTGDLRVATAGANPASVVTVGGTQTLTNKTINTTGTITSGAITTSGKVTASTYFASSTAAAVLSAVNGSVYLRPTGQDATAQQVEVDVNGNMGVQGHITSVGTVTANAYFHSTNANTILSGSGGTIHLRPYGKDNGTAQFYVQNDGQAISSYHVRASQNFWSTTTNVVLQANGGEVYFRPHVDSGTAQAYVNRYGTLVVNPWYNGNGITVNKSLTGQGQGVQAYGCSGTGAFLGYCDNTGYYGYVGLHEVNVRFWGLYSNVNTYSGGGFTSSDEQIKEHFSDCDCADAYSKVMAIPVKNYRKKMQYATDEIGFTAQDIEKVIPHAVLDVGIPDHDEETRRLVGGKNTIKATNDRTLLGVLWAAVQHQSHMIEHMQAKIAALEGK